MVNNINHNAVWLNNNRIEIILKITRYIKTQQYYYCKIEQKLKGCLYTTNNLQPHAPPQVLNVWLHSYLGNVMSLLMI